MVGLIRLPFLRSLRGRLVSLSILLEIIVIAAVSWNSQRLSEEHMVRQFEIRRAEITLLLQAALAPVMAQRDFEGVRQTLLSVQRDYGLNYLAMMDERGQVVAAVNLPDPLPLPLPNPYKGDIFALKMFDMNTQIALEDRDYGELVFGIDLRFLHEARHSLLLQNTLVGLLGMLLSALAVTLLSLWLTRRLTLLSTAVSALGEGRGFRTLPKGSEDDLGQLIEAFNHMSGSLHRRIHDLYIAESNQRALNATIETERGRLGALLAAIRLGLIFIGPDGEIIYMNPAFREVWQLDANTLVADPFEHLDDLRAYLKARHPAPSFSRLFSHPDKTTELLFPDGRVVTQFAVPVTGAAGRDSGQLWIFEDVTVEHQTAARLIYMAERDPLTGLANRARFEQELTQLVNRHARDGATQAAVLYFDIDEFKYINDSFGHRAGDKVLTDVAEAVTHLIRSDELFARLGGDEFVLVAHGADQISAQALAERVHAQIRKLNFEFEERRIALTISLGIALFPAHAQTSEELVSRADAAMYQAKRAGKNCWRLYRPDLDQSASMLNQLGWNEKIQSALLNNQLCLHFQGVHDTATGRVSHYEALVRMIDPEHPDQLILPGAFIPAAERTGRIVDIDRWVIQAAIQTLARMPELPALAVNVSARSFDDPTLAQAISDWLRESGVEPKRLYAELTETSALSNMQDSERFITDICQLGCTVCLDDFGVGFSSFAYLKHLSADVLKIDGMFIRSLLNSREDQIFVRAIVDVARGLGKKTVAEFVGDAATLQLLRDIGVDYAQGYYLSKPVPEISPV